MKKKFLILYLIFFMLFGTTISPAMASGLKCNKKSGFTVYDEQNKTCINPTENLKYKYNDGLRINSIEASCNKKAGYTQIKDDKCYNPKTKLSYRIKYEYKSAKGSEQYNEVYDFYLNDEHCGTNCDYSGKNCASGFCNVKSCARHAGYNTIDYGKCFNPKTQISYNSDAIFYKEYKSGYSSPCGMKCNIYGKKCKQGACYTQDCAKGYQLKGDSYRFVCQNPKTSLSYDKDGNFYHDLFKCGKNCDINGRNCEVGICNKKDCLAGYTKFEKSFCINPKTGFVYEYDEDIYRRTGKEFSFYSSDDGKNAKGEYVFIPCGTPINKHHPAKCDKNGANCKRLKQPCTMTQGECTFWDDATLIGGFGLLAIGAVVAAPIYLPYFWITEKIPDKQPDIKVNYLEKNKIK